MVFKVFKISVLIISLLFFSITKSQIVVNNTSELQTAIANASAGSEIILATGTWNNVFININKNATASQPIIIRTQNPGSVFLTGNSRVYMRGNHITVAGLVFQNPSNLIVDNDVIEPIFELNQCDNCKVINNKIDAYNGTDAQKTMKFKWVYLVDGQYNEIAHNSFIGKYGVGSIINDNRSLANADYLKIHHNYFADRVPVDNDVNGLNDQDAIRIGTSTTSLSDSYSEVYDNYFYNWSGEVEIISNKSGKNKYYNNTFRDYQGTLTLRHGNGCEVFNNYFFANNNAFTGGVRIIGEDHKIYNNYIEGVNSFKPSGSGSNVTGGINVMNGVTNSALSGYYQVKNTQVINNTLVNCDYAIRVGTSLGGTEEPENLTVANNIMYNTSINAYQINTSPSGNSVAQGNITQNGTWHLSNGTNNNQTVSNGLLESGTDFFRITDASAAIDASVGSYSFINNDLLGGTRDENPDAGAEEFGANGTNLPYTNSDVGEKIGFLSNVSDQLLTSTNTINFNIDSGSKSFDINSNINWSISENSDWLSVSTLNGSNSETINITVTENNSGAARTATLIISQNNGDLSTTLQVNQSLETFNIDDAIALTGLTVTGVGTQDPNIPENTIDSDDSSRWSANSTDGSAYLTYNLQCKKTVTSVKIYFHKGAQRTTSFKIATSNDGTNFTDITEVITSAGNIVGFEDFPFSPFQEIQYLRIYGFGNSEGSGWNSIEEVQIFGDDTCAALSLHRNNLIENHISFYPNPTKEMLNIKADNQIGWVQIFDINGKNLISKKIETKQGLITTASLVKGVYLVKNKGIVYRFIKE
tara:strand:- start:39436 stop:41880 length:2445 start_codon:yes stop_codon:yes gene_type:complete